MKFVSVFILVCAFACASAQFGVKGGASGSSSGVRAGPFFPRLTPGSIQEKKDQLQLANVEEVAGGPSVSGGAVSTGSSGFVQPAVQQENVVTFVQERPSQGVLVPSSGSLPSVGSVSVPVSTSVGPQTPVIQTPVQSSFSFVPSFQPALPAPTVAQVSQPAVQTVQSTVQSVPSFFAPVQTKTFQPSNRYLFDSNFLYDLRQPAQFAAAPAPVPSFPNFAQNIVHFAPQPQVATVQTVPSFASNGFASGAFGPVTVGKVGKQFVAPAVVSQSEQLLPFSPFPSGFASVPAVPSVQTVPSGLPVPSVSSGALPGSSFPSTGAAVTPVSGKVFTDNRISSAGFSGVQSQLPVISQEKQSADTVQTTEW